MKTIRYTNTAFLHRVADHEGFRSRPYQDPSGCWTIGFGHTHGVTKDTPSITYDDALLMLAHELEDIRSSLSSEPYSLTSTQWDAIVDFCYNLGITAYKNSTLRKRIIEYSNLLDECNFVQAKKVLSDIKYQFERWKYVTLPDGTKKVYNGLLIRRVDESNLFVSEVSFNR